MRVQLIKNNNIVELISKDNGESITFPDGDKISLHESNLGYIMMPHDIASFSKSNQTEFEVPDSWLTSLIYSFIDEKDILRLPANEVASKFR